MQPLLDRTPFGEKPTNFRYDISSSYPDWLLTIPYPTAINFIILNTPVNIVLASQFKNNIHLSPGVEMPREIEYDLSVGMRYMFHTKRNSALISEAWKDFERRVRWRLAFAFQGDENDLYDPDYEVDKIKKEYSTTQITALSRNRPSAWPELR